MCVLIQNKQNRLNLNKQMPIYIQKDFLRFYQNKTQILKLMGQDCIKKTCQDFSNYFRGPSTQFDKANSQTMNQINKKKTKNKELTKNTYRQNKIVEVVTDSKESESTKIVLTGRYQSRNTAHQIASVRNYIVLPPIQKKAIAIKQYDFCLKMMNKTKVQKIQNIAGNCTFGQMLFKIGQFKVFCQNMNEFEIGGVAISINSKGYLYSRIKGQKIQDWASKVGILSKQQNPNIINRLMVFVRSNGGDGSILNACIDLEHIQQQSQVQK